MTFLPHLGATSTVVQPRYAIIAPDGYMPNTLAGWHNTEIVTTISPAMGANFVQYIATMGEDSHAVQADMEIQRFIYVLEGSLTLHVDGVEHELHKDAFAYLPVLGLDEIDPILGVTLRKQLSSNGAKLCVFESTYDSNLEGETLEAPDGFIGRAEDCAKYTFKGHEGAEAQALLPDSFDFDMAVYLLHLQPGATLPLVETHFMEHGCYMLEGSAIFRFNQNDWHTSMAGDTLWIGGYCPHWVACVGDIKQPLRYLLYRNAHRHPLMNHIIR